MLKRIKKTYKRKYTRRKQTPIFDQGNCFLSESEDKRRRKHLSYFILFLASLLVIIPCLFLLKTRIEQNVFIDSEQEILKEQKAVTMVMLFYRHERSYPEYCQSLGLPLVNYPKVFSSHFAPHRDALDLYLKEKRGFGLEPAYRRLKTKFGQVIPKSVALNFEKMATILSDYQDKNVKLSHQEICGILEERSLDVLKTAVNPDYETIEHTFNVLKSE